MSIESKLREFVAERFLFDARAEVAPDQSLVRAGVMDSTGVMELVVYLEDAFKIKIADAELVPENFDTLRAMAAFVERKMAAAGGGNGTVRG